MGAKSKANELTLSRIYDAPVSLVWDAWTDPQKVAKWWGPRGWTITTHSKDLKVGGIWHYTMHGPDGTNIPQKTIYHEVEKEARLVYDHGGYDDREPLFRVTVTFKETKGRTKMDMTMAFASAEKAVEIGKFIKQASGYSTWDRLAEYLDKESTGKEKFVINRSFGASINTMFELWTNPEHFSKWLPPTGFTMKFIGPAAVKPGHTNFYEMTEDTGKFKMWGKCHYLEVTSPYHLLYTQWFTDEKGELSRHPMAPTWPAKMLTKVTLTEEAPEQTRVTIEWEIFGEATQAEMETFIAGRAGMTQGWTGSFDKLENYLNR